MNRVPAVTYLLIIVAIGYAGAWELIYWDAGHYARWKDSDLPVTYRANESGTPDCGGEFTALEASLDTWTNVTTSYFDFNYGPKTSKKDTKLDGVNLFYWAETQADLPYAGNYIAVNTFWTSGEDMGDWYATVETDICFNGYHYDWSDSGESGKMDVQNIATHETGHALALADLYDVGSKEFTMCGYSSYGETKKRTLEYDDIRGISSAELYGYTGITLEDFEAAAGLDNIEVTWVVSSETGLAGYNLYRALDGEAEYAKLNAALISGESPYYYLDEEFEPGMTYKYLLEAVDIAGGTETFGPDIATAPTGDGRPVLSLAQNSPNPVTNDTSIRFSIPEAGRVSLGVYDLTGRKVITLYDGDANAGEHELEWDLRGDRGVRVAPGVYLYRLMAGGENVVRKMVVR
ncbi:MAG: zinc-dependent metalloprotease [Candidatus Coatesbacteria bacterium]|nr:MAG: zinc-dependent metalloprotease [Candidatus Coatesbacteria bacterium]